jgi:hypothetical protein
MCIVTCRCAETSSGFCLTVSLSGVARGGLPMEQIAPTYRLCNTTRRPAVLNSYCFRIFELGVHFLNCRVSTIGPIIRREVV